MATGLIERRRPPWTARVVLVALGLLLLDGVFVDPAAAQDNNLEQSVKAAYLLKLGAFVDWPDVSSDSPTSAVRLCVVGDDPFGNLLERAAQGQRVKDRPVVIQRLRTATREPHCHIMFVAGSADQSVMDALAAVQGTPTLTITDAARRPGAKGVVNFVVHEKRVRFEIDDKTAAENGLSISSKVLSLAIAVRPRSS